MTFIIKRMSSDREEFEAEKIGKAIKKAYIDAELSLEEHAKEIEGIVKSVVKHFRGQEAVPSSFVRDLVVAELEKIRPKAAEEWKRFEEKYKKK